MSNTDQALKEKIVRIMGNYECIRNDLAASMCANEIVDLINEQQPERDFIEDGNDFGKGMMEVVVPSLNTLLRRLENALEEDK